VRFSTYALFISLILHAFPSAFAKNTCNTSFDLPKNTWRMITLPCEPPAGEKTVQDIFGDDFSKAYGTGWIMFGYDSSDNPAGYQKQTLTSELKIGKGYWIYSVSESAKLDLPAGSIEAASNRSAACSSENGCFSLPLAANTSKPEWNLLGHPYLSSVLLSELRITTDSATSPNNCGDDNGCTLKEAQADGVFNAQLFVYQAQAKGYASLSAGDKLEPWMGFWGAALKNAAGLNLRLLIPSPSISIAYPLHKAINTTVFWVGEPADESNGYIQNSDSAWDELWKEHYGGFDDPDNRNGYFPPFTPLENPFYFALPFNDFNDKGGKKKRLLEYVPWASASDDPANSILKNRWIKIQRGDKTVYAQWEDSGPFVYDDWSYVFGSGSEMPANKMNNNAGLDVSPAVRDYLGLEGMGLVSWQFVDENQVPDGPWTRVITRSPVYWGD